MELLADLNRSGVPCALVTMSYRRFVAPILAALPDDAFTTVVTGDAVSQGKPHPEPYLKAARNLGVPPGDCLAIEDSNTGARSAVAAGCTVLVVPNHVPVLPGGGPGLRRLAGRCSTWPRSGPVATGPDATVCDAPASTGRHVKSLRDRDLSEAFFAGVAR